MDDAPLYDDMFIYLKKKSKKGDRMFHKVKDGETLHGISQNVGVQLKYLYSYNNLYEGEEPAVGEKVYLQGRSTKTPRLRGNATAAPIVKATKKEVVEEAAKEVLTAKKPDEKVVSKTARKIEKNDFLKTG